MAIKLEAAMYFAAAALCLVVVAFLLQWGRPINGELSPGYDRGRWRGLITAIAVMTSLMRPRLHTRRLFGLVQIRFSNAFWFWTLRSVRAAALFSIQSRWPSVSANERLWKLTTNIRSVP